MKKYSKLSLLALMMGLLFVVAACGKKTAEELTNYNVLNGFTESNSGVYTITENTDANLDFSYNKGAFPDAFLQSRAITKNLSGYKKLVITLEGMGSVLVTLETKDDTPSKSIGLNVSAIKGTYEWNLMASSDFLSKVNKVTIIAAPSKEDSMGQVNISKLMFETSIADGYIVNDGFNNIQTNVNEYNGTDKTFDINNKWESNDPDVYNITYEAKNAVVNYDKTSGLEWAFMRTRVQGNFSSLNYAVFIVQGTKGHKLLIKPNEFNAAEAFIWLSGDEQELVINLNALSTEEKASIADFKVFIAAGVAPAAGELTIKEAFMTDTYEYEEPIFETNVYDGESQTFMVENWYDSGDLAYDIENMDGAYLVDYKKATSNLEWAYMFSNLSGNFSNFERLEFEITGQTSKNILLKVESESGNKEQQFTFDGSRQTFTIDLTAMTTPQLETLNKIVLFAAAGSTGSGNFTIHSATFKSSDYQVDTPWESLDADVYTFSGKQSVMVHYEKVATQEWSAIKNTLNTQKVDGLNVLTIVIKGEVGKSVLIKPNNNTAFEKKIEFDTTEAVTLLFESVSFSSIIIFGEGGIAPATGSFEIVSATLSHVAVDIDYSGTYPFNDKWTANSETIYAFDVQADKTVVSYTKLAGNDWEWFRVVFDQKEIAGMNTLTIVLKGTVGKQVLVKPNDQGSLERFITFIDDQPITAVFSVDQFISLFMFAEGGVAPASG